MLDKLTTVNVWVNDQDEALEFYTKKLGMEVRDDVTVPEMGNFRWLTVAPPQVRGRAGADDRPGAAGVRRGDAEQLETLVAKGAAGGLFFATDDCRGTYEELKAKGVEFSQEPTEQPYGLDAGFRDSSGNSMRMMQT